jgi:hypothetical protein
VIRQLLEHEQTMNALRKLLLQHERTVGVSTFPFDQHVSRLTSKLRDSGGSKKIGFETIMKCWLLHRDGVRLRGQVVRSVSSIDPSVNRPFIIDEVRERITESLHVPPLTTRSVTPLHCTAPHRAALHCTALHCTALHCTALHYGAGTTCASSRTARPARARRTRCRRAFAASCG